MIKKIKEEFCMECITDMVKAIPGIILVGMAMGIGWQITQHLFNLLF